MKSANRPVARWNQVAIRANMKPLLYLCLLLAPLVSGCTHQYVWKKYKIEPERVSLGTLPAGTAVALVNGQTESEAYELGSVGAHHYHGSLNQLTDAVISQLAQELEDRGAVVREGAAKTLEVTVVDAKCTTGGYMLCVEMHVRTKTGSGYVMEAPISNRTPMTVPRAYNGAVALTVIAILNDSAMADYLKN